MSLPSDIIIYLSKIIILAILGPKIEFLGSTEVPGSSDINGKATSDIHSTNKVDQNLEEAQVQPLACSPSSDRFLLRLSPSYIYWISHRMVSQKRDHLLCYSSLLPLLC